MFFGSINVGSARRRQMKSGRREAEHRRIIGGSGGILPMSLKIRGE